MAKHTWSTPTARVKPSLLNQNVEYLELAATTGTVQVPFTALKSTGTWTNEGNLAADRTTVEAGINGTINTGSSTGTFSTDKYILNSTITPLIGTTDTTGTWSNILNAFDNDFDTFARFSTNSGNASATIGKTFSSKFIPLIQWTVQFSADAQTGTMTVQTYDGSVWTTVDTVFSGSSGFAKTTGITQINQEVQGIRIRCRNSPTGGGFSTRTYYIFELQEFDEYSNSTLICDTNTLTLRADETGISLYNPSTIPTDTSIKVTLNDGTKDISTETTLSENDTTVIPLTATPVIDSTLELHYSLETTDTSKTPEWYGYGVYKF